MSGAKQMEVADPPEIPPRCREFALNFPHRRLFSFITLGCRHGITVTGGFK
jgi:hypothetical protein